MIYDAIQASLEAHKDQLRKLENDAYVAHPLEVAIILAQNGAPESVIAAGILHDTVEDTDMNLLTIQNRFGSEVATYVQGCTEPDKTTSWHDRKQWAIAHLHQQACQEVRMIICADKLSNMRSIARNYRLHGHRVWQGFHAPYEWQKWYYTCMLHGLSSLETTDMYKELKQLIIEVFGPDIDTHDCSQCCE